MTQNDVSETKRREYGYLAAQAASKKDIDGARALLKKTPLQVQDSVARDRLEASYDSDEAVASMAEREYTSYLTRLNGLDVTQLPVVFDRAVSRLSGPAQEGLAKFLEKYKGKTVGQVGRVLYEADSKRKAEPGLYDPKALEEANQTLQTHQPYMQLKSFLQGMHFKPLMAEVETEKEDAVIKNLEDALTNGKL